MADPAYVGENPYYVPLDYTYTPLSPGGGGGGSGNGVGAGGGQPFQQLGIGPLATPQQQAAFGIDSLASSRGDTGRALYGGPEGQLTGGGGVYTEGRLGDMNDAQIQRAYSDMMGSPTGIVKPGSADMFNKSVSQMQDALRGQQITSTGNWMNDLGLTSRSLLEQAPFRQVGKIVKGLYEGATGYGQDSWDAVQDWNKRLVALQKGEQPEEAKLDVSVLAKIIDKQLEDQAKDSGEATAAPSITRSVNPLANVNIDERRERRRGRAERAGEERAVERGGVSRKAQGGLMSLAEGGRPGFAGGSDEENEFSIFSPSTWFEEEETPNTNLYGEPETIYYNEKSYTMPAQIFPTQGYDLGIGGEALQRYLEENENMKNFYRESPEMMPDDWINKAQGGRIGYARGRVVHPGGYAGDPEDYNNAQEYWGDAWDPNYADILISHWERLSGKSDPSMSSGGRVGFKKGSDPWDPPGSFDNARDYWGPVWSLDPMMQDALIKIWENETGKSDPRDYKATGGRIGFWEGGLVGYSRGGIAGL